jgi:uncharacterized membrane protein HdeD (DUF308 family)
MKFILGLIFGLFLILSGIFSLVLYVSLRTKADSWLTSIAIFSLFGLGVGLIALGIRRFMVLFRKPVDRQKKD